MRSFAVSLVILLGLLVGAAAPAFAEIPNLLRPRSSPDAPPVWVSERSAVTQEGYFRWELFSEISKGILTSYLENQERERGRSTSPGNSPAQSLLQSPNRRVDCQAFFSRPEPHYLESKRHDSLKELAENSLLIVTGRVSEITQGFYAGFPTSLITIEDPKFLKRPVEFTATTVAYVSFPHAAISAGGHSFCTHESSFPDRPESGDRLLMFAYEINERTDPLILEPFASGLILERPFSGLEISDDLHDDLLLSSLRRMDEVESQLGEILSQGESK